MNRFITAPLYASKYPKRQLKNSLTHAVLLGDGGEMVRVLCEKVQLESVHEDSTLHSVTKEPTCETCAARLKALRTH